MSTQNEKEQEKVQYGLLLLKTQDRLSQKTPPNVLEATHYMEKVYPIQKPIINFSDTLFVYKFHEGEIRHHAVTDYTLAYVYSGEMTIVNNTKTTKLYAGDCVFLSRNNKVKVSARPYNGIELKSVFLTFTRPFLVRYCHNMDKSLLPSSKTKRMHSIVLPGLPWIISPH